MSMNLVAILMHDSGIAGLPGPAKVKRVKGIPTLDDVVRRKFARSMTDELWVTDITEHRTREGKVCCCVLDTCSRRIVGWSFTERVRQSGLMPSFGSVGDAFDCAMMESFWSSMQIELLDRNRWNTRLELTNAIFDYIEVFYNRRRRHSQLDYMTPAEFELTLTTSRTA